MPQNDYQWVLDTYPEFITKEQLYRICKVSKKTAQHYLENGFIPCQNTGKKTRQYTIRTADVVAFLHRRDDDPEACGALLGWYRQGKTQLEPRIYTPYMQNKLANALSVILENYPDVLTSNQVTDITGYHHETIVRWCSKKKVEYLTVRRAYLIPKDSLMTYLTDHRCQAISLTAKEHILKLAKELCEQDDSVSV